MLTHHAENIPLDPTEAHATTVFIGRVEENAQTTVKDTGWTAEDKERMEQYGYNSLDMVRAWYS